MEANELGAGMPGATRPEETAAPKQAKMQATQPKGSEGGFLVLNLKEQAQVETIVETFIPTDENGPGAKEAGVVYFIDKQLATQYGYNGAMYMKEPFIMPNQEHEINVNGIKYSKGSATARVESGARYQYPMLLRFFWRKGLEAFDAYCKGTYGDSFEKLPKKKKIQALSDLFDNKPTEFKNIIPRDFFYELFFMSWSGFLMDPIYGGNQNKVGWEYTGFAGLACAKDANKAMALMVADKPTRLEPVSLSEYQKFLKGGK